LILLALYLSFVRKRRRGIRRQERANGQNNSQESNSRSIQPQPRDKTTARKHRYETIEGWVFSKMVHEHDVACDLITGSSSSTAFSGIHKLHHKHRSVTLETVLTTADATASDEETGGSTGDKNDTDHSLYQIDRDDDVDASQLSIDGECSICYEHMQVGEIVSWSPNPNCQHVFHHTCIKEWLLDHSACPFCRQTFLPADTLEDCSVSARNLIRNVLPDVVFARQHRTKECFYCVQHRVVYLSSEQKALLETTTKAKTTKTTATLTNITQGDDEKSGEYVQHLLSMRASTIPSRDELVALRGDYSARGCLSSSEDQVVGISHESHATEMGDNITFTNRAPVSSHAEESSTESSRHSAPEISVQDEERLSPEINIQELHNNY